MKLGSKAIGGIWTTSKHNSTRKIFRSTLYKLIDWSDLGTFFILRRSREFEIFACMQPCSWNLYGDKFLYGNIWTSCKMNFLLCVLEVTCSSRCLCRIQMSWKISECINTWFELLLGLLSEFVLYVTFTLKNNKFRNGTTSVNRVTCDSISCCFGLRPEEMVILVLHLLLNI